MVNQKVTKNGVLSDGTELAAAGFWNGIVLLVQNLWLDKAQDITITERFSHHMETAQEQGKWCPCLHQISFVNHLKKVIQTKWFTLYFYWDYKSK